jgi:hypothetical protein
MGRHVDSNAHATAHGSVPVGQRDFQSDGIIRRLGNRG